MATRQEKVSAGLFLLTGVILLFGTAATLAGLRLQRESKEYLIRFNESVGGLTIGSDVVYLGVRVGEVQDISFDHDDVGTLLVQIVVDEQTPIKTGTYATLESNLITASTSIELSGGNSREGDLPEDSEIPWKRTSLRAMGESLTATMEGFEQLLQRANALFSDENREAIEGVVKGMEQLVTQAGDDLEVAREEVSRIRLALEGLAGSVDEGLLAIRTELTGQVDRGVDAVVQAADSVTLTAERLERLVVEARAVARSIDQAMQGADEVLGDNRVALARTLEHLRTSARNLSELLEQLEAQPAALLRDAPRTERRRGE